MNAAVELLTTAWGSVIDLGSALTYTDWQRPTSCAGWSTKDVLSHLADSESRWLQLPRPEHVVPVSVRHIRNETGAINEVGVDLRRPRSATEVLAEYRDLTERSRKLLTEGAEADLEEKFVDTGSGTISLWQSLPLRIADTWCHEQDIRRAVGRPGHETGAVVDAVLAYFSSSLPYVVARRAGASNGVAAAFCIGERVFTVSVTGGRGELIEPPGEASVTLVIPPVTFAMLLCGRTDAPTDYEIEGDDELGRRIIDSMAVVP